MTPSLSSTVTLRARGPLACFTRPELKSERVSYLIPTPSAARGLLEAVLWKPAMRWHVRRIRVLSEIALTAFRRNEVSTKAPRVSRAIVEDGGPAPLYFADEDRAQRNTVALRDVDYLIEAEIALTRRAGPDDNLKKFVDMFERRVRKGQHFHQPYFGCREFAAEVMPPVDAPPPIDVSRDLGIMLWDLDYGQKPHRPRFFAARLEHGVLEVPADPESSLLTVAGDAS